MTDSLSRPTPARPTTPRQTEILDWILREILRGRPPSLREIGTRFGIESPNGVNCHVTALLKRGILSKVEGKSRGLVVPGGIMYLPLRGGTAAGLLSANGVEPHARDVSRNVLDTAVRFLNGSEQERVLLVVDDSLDEYFLPAGTLVVLRVAAGYRPREDVLVTGPASLVTRSRYYEGMEGVIGAVSCTLHIGADVRCD